MYFFLFCVGEHSSVEQNEDDSKQTDGDDDHGTKTMETFRNLGYFRQKVTSDGMWVMLGVGTMYTEAMAHSIIVISPS